MNRSKFTMEKSKVEKEALQEKPKELESFENPEQYLKRIENLDRVSAEKLFNEFKKDEVSINPETSFGQKALNKFNEVKKAANVVIGKNKEFYNSTRLNLLKKISMIGIAVSSLVGPVVKEEATEKEEIENIPTIGYMLPEIKIYGHHDELTDHILNYLTNKEELPLKDKVDFLKNVWTKDPKEKEKISKMTQEEFKKYIEYEDGEGTIDDYFMAMSEFDPNEYEAIWEMHGKYGSPKMRPEYESFSGGNEYHPSFLSGGTIYTDYSNQSKIGWLAELSHSKQFQENPLKSYLAYGVSLLRTAKRAIEQGSFSDAYSKEYSERGSLEHEAHQIIRPKLEKEFYSYFKLSPENLEVQNKAKEEILGTIKTVDQLNDRNEVEKATAKINEEMEKVVDLNFIDQAKEEFAKISKSRIEKEGRDKIIEELRLHLIGGRLFQRSQQLRAALRQKKLKYKTLVEKFAMIFQDNAIIAICLTNKKLLNK